MRLCSYDEITDDRTSTVEIIEVCRLVRHGMSLTRCHEYGVFCRMRISLLFNIFNFCKYKLLLCCRLKHLSHRMIALQDYKLPLLTA